MSSLSDSPFKSFAETLDDISELPRCEDDEEEEEPADPILLWPMSTGWCAEASGPPLLDGSPPLLVEVDDRDWDDLLWPADPPLELDAADPPPPAPPAARRIVQFNETRQLGFFDLALPDDDDDDDAVLGLVVVLFAAVAACCLVLELAPLPFVPPPDIQLAKYLGDCWGSTAPPSTTAGPQHLPLHGGVVVVDAFRERLPESDSECSSVAAADGDDDADCCCFRQHGTTVGDAPPELSPTVVVVLVVVVVGVVAGVLTDDGVDAAVAVVVAVLSLVGFAEPVETVPPLDDVAAVVADFEELPSTTIWSQAASASSSLPASAAAIATASC